MLRAKKEGVVADLVERLRTADTLIVADYRGLTHAELDGVRTKLIEHGARLSVCKNTLTRRAAEEAGVDALLEFLTGPTAIAFVSDGDMVAVAKTLDDTARTTRRLALKGAVLSGRAVGQDAVKGLAALPPTDVLRGQVLAAIIAPLTSMLGLVNAPLQSVVGLIDGRIDQLTARGDAAAAAEPGPAPEEPAEAADEEAVEAGKAEATGESMEDEAPTAEEPAAQEPAEAAGEAAGTEDTTKDAEAEEN